MSKPELTKQALEDMVFLGGFSETVRGDFFKGYMADDDGGGKVYLSESDFRNLSESCNEVANILEFNREAKEASHE